MTKLACNVVSYLPDPKLLAAKFRPWHTEALLDQAAFLIERCLGDFKEYSDLDYRWKQTIAGTNSPLSILSPRPASAFDRLPIRPLLESYSIAARDNDLRSRGSPTAEAAELSG